MCVIFLAETHRPTDDMVERAFQANASGAGVAWREGGLVKWDKGLTVEEMKEYFRTLPLPMVGHFRIPTCGGVRPSLCHPFPIAKDAPLDLRGQTKGYVLFHNGHWIKWKDSMMEAVVRHNLHTPGGKWSDSRAMAWSAAHFGLFMLDLIDEKSLAFGPKDMEIFGRGWEKAGSGENEIWVSNKHWEHVNRTGNYSSYGYTGGGTLCRYGTCKEVKFSTYDYCSAHLTHDRRYRENTAADEEGRAGGTSDHASFRAGGDRKELGPGAQPQTAQEAAKAAGETGDGGAVEEGKGGEKAIICHPIVSWARSFNPKRPHGSPKPHLNGHKTAEIILP